jgi:hypothetical protein
MEQDLLLLQDQAGGMDAAAADRWAALKKRWALRGHAQVIGSRHSMSRTCGPRDMISLVIPRIGDNSPWDFDKGICAQKKWNETPYTLGPSFSSTGQVLLGVCP